MIEGFRFQRSCNHIHISIIGLASMLCWLSFPHHVFVTNYASNELRVRLLYANLVSGFNHQTQIGSFPQVGIKIPKNIKKHRSNHLVLKLSRDILLFPIKTPKTTVSDLRSCPFPKVGHTPSFHQRLGLFAIGEFSPQFFSCLLTKLFVSNGWYAPHTFPKRGTTSQCLIQQMKASRSLISETTLSFDSNL